MSNRIGPERNANLSSDPCKYNIREKTSRQGGNLGTRATLGSVLFLTAGVALHDNVQVPTGEYQTISGVSSDGVRVQLDQIYQGSGSNKTTAEIFLYNYPNFQEGKEAAKRMVEYFFQAYPLSIHLKDYDFWVRNPSGMEDLRCEQNGNCQDEPFQREINRVISATRMISQETFVLIKSNNQGAGGQGSVAQLGIPPSIYNFVGVMLPTDLISDNQKMAPAHEWGARMGFRDSTDQTSIMGNVGVRRFNDAESAWIEQVFANNWVFSHLTPSLEVQSGGLSSKKIGLQSLRLADLNLVSLINSPEGTDQLKILISPAPNKFSGQPDGRDIPIQWGSLTGVNKPLRHALTEVGLIIREPVMGQGPYIVLPDMTYTWKVCASGLMTPVLWNSEKWEEVEIWPGRKIHVPCQEFKMQTPPTDSTTITPVMMAGNMETKDLTPTLQWQNSRTNIFYYEVQLSTDADFETSPEKAKAAVFWNLIHGGETRPINSWTVPDNFPLEVGKTYFWRVRPRVQGDGIEVAWTPNFSFKTGSDARVQAMQTDFGLIQKEDGQIDWHKMQEAYNQRRDRNLRRMAEVEDYSSSPVAVIRKVVDGDNITTYFDPGATLPKDIVLPEEELSDEVA